MSHFLTFVSNMDAGEPDPIIVEQASSCLDRFTDAFNSHDPAGMDAQLKFPHVMISEAESLVWEKPGSHPSDFFDNLRGTGWAFTQYESKVAVFGSANKVHFVADRSWLRPMNSTLGCLAPYRDSKRRYSE